MLTTSAKCKLVEFLASRNPHRPAQVCNRFFIWLNKMSDDCGGDTVPGCADTGRDSYESGGGNDDSSYMDLTECTEITFTENIGYERDYYDGVVNQHHVNIH